MVNSRTDKSIKNIKYSLIGQISSVIISFISRTFFVKILTTEYLGLSGLFSNVLFILSLTEMGFGTAITYELYKPLAENNIEKIKSLMHYYKKIYTFIGIIMIILGIITIPIYPFFIKEIPNIPNLNLIYFLFVLNSASSYFLAYKRILLVSDQKKYIESIYKYIFYFLLNVFQIVALLLFKNYILFLIIQVSFTILENVTLSIRINKIYPYLLDKNYKKIDVENKKSIFGNLKYMFIHRCGGVVLSSTDNIVTSKYIGLKIVGLYSNYYLIINALEKIIDQVFTSIIASIGNLNVTANKERKTMIFYNLFFVDYVITIFVCNNLLNLLNPFINIWLGEAYMLDFLTVVIIVLNQYIYGLRRAAQAFRNATGNFKKDWFSPIIESIINIFISIILAKKIGLVGVFLGTIISSLCTNFWLEPYVVIKKTTNTSLKQYFRVYFKYCLSSILIFAISYYICGFLKASSIIMFLLRIIISSSVSIGIIILLYARDENFVRILEIIRKRKKNNI